MAETKDLFYLAAILVLEGSQNDPQHFGSFYWLPLQSQKNSSSVLIPENLLGPSSLTCIADHTYTASDVTIRSGIAQKC